MADRFVFPIILLTAMLVYFLVNTGAAEACNGRCRIVQEARTVSMAGYNPVVVDYHAKSPEPLSPPPCRCVPDPSWSERVNHNYLRSNLIQNARPLAPDQEPLTPGRSFRRIIGDTAGTLPLFLSKSSLVI